MVFSNTVMTSQLASLHSVGVRRNGRWLVHNIDLAVHRGEIVSLIGPNGGGKTTVTKVIAGSLKPDTGTVMREKGLKIGYVPQKIQIDSTLPMTVQRLMKIPKKHKPKEIDSALSEMNIRHLATAPIQKLSGGEFQRALIARALLRNPDLLILDEPSQGLDVRGEAKLYDRIASIRDRMNCGVILVCHNLHIVMAKTDTVVCMNVHVCCTGTPEHVKSNEAYLNLFARDAAQSHALYTHDHDHSHRLDGSITDS